MGYIYARLIWKGLKTLEDVPIRYRQDTIDAYYDLFGEILE